MHNTELVKQIYAHFLKQVILKSADNVDNANYDCNADNYVEFYLYPTVGTVLIHSIKPELTE